MSLECAECGRLMGPSALPGSEGTLVSPYLYSIVWDRSDGELKWLLRPALVRANRSLCFRCIDDACPENQRPLLTNLYETYLTEMSYRQLEEIYSGRWLSGGEGNEMFEAYEEFKRRFEQLPKNLFFLQH
jgi:hypothetical protein